MSDDAREATEARASLLLSQRDHSSNELRDKLLRKGFEREHVDDVIGAFVQRGWIDDFAFATRQAEILADQQWGPLQIKKKLMKHGVDASMADDAVDGLDVDWLANARARVERKYGDLDEDGDVERAFRHLSYRGFLAATARRVVFDD